MAASVGMLCALVLVALVSWSAQTEDLLSGQDICRYFKDGVKLRKPGTCSESIVCENHTSTDDTQCGTQLWDRNKQTCVMSTSDKYCSAPCTKSSPTYVSDPKNCQGWYQCNGAKEVTHGLCNEGLYFDQGQQLCMYPSQTSCEATYEICDVAPDGVAFWDEFNCHKYFTCDTNGLVENTCDTGLYFDLASGSCIPKAQVECYKHPYPENVCGTRKLAIRNHFVRDQATCSGYFYCKDLGSVNLPDPEPNWGRCPDNLFFDKDLEACADRNYVKCEEDRCDGIASGRVLSSTSGCQHYLICEDNSTSDEIPCDDGEYFDPVLGDCTSTVKSYPSCS